ncbi:MAG: hypothetical protein HZC55_13125 [Verrucomicrobia bacterium]|nr:hypothetical protein [Verrucomicrobiota bacterium]
MKIRSFTGLLRLPLGLCFAINLCSASGPAPPGISRITDAILTTDETVRRELVELDRLLDSKPALEDVLRTSIDRMDDERFRRSMPEIEILLIQRPGIVPALKVERHFLIYRHVLRRTRGPLLRADMIAFDTFLRANPEIRRKLDDAPSQIVAGDFLMAHPSLAGFFEQHPSLSSVLLGPLASPGPRKGSGPPADHELPDKATPAQPSGSSRTILDRP